MSTHAYDRAIERIDDGFLAFIFPITMENDDGEDEIALYSAFRPRSPDWLAAGTQNMGLALCAGMRGIKHQVAQREDVKVLSL